MRGTRFFKVDNIEQQGVNWIVLLNMHYSGVRVTTPVPQDVNNPYQYISRTARAPHATTSQPLVTGLQQQQQPSISQQSSHGQQRTISNSVSDIV